MSFLGFAILFSVAAGMLGRAALTARNDEPHASLAQVISCVAYLALLLAGTLPLQLLWSGFHVLQFFFRPTAYQVDQQRYYPDRVLPAVVVCIGCIEVLVWLIFQQIR